MTLKPAITAVVLLSVACAGIASAQGKQVEIAPVPTNRPPMVKKAIGKCVRSYSSRESPNANELQAGMQAPLLAQGYAVVRNWVFASSVMEPRGGVVDCMYKLVIPGGSVANEYASYSFNCKGAQKQAEDTWSCEV